MGIHFDTSEVDRLAADLAAGPRRLRAEAGSVLKASAGRVKRSMARDASGHRYLAGLGDRVNYDKRGEFEYEIGIDKGGVGSLGNIAAFGTSNNAPVFDHTASLRGEAPILADRLGDVAEDAVLGGGE